MGTIANNYVQPLCFWNDVYINPHPIPFAPGTVSLMQAILQHHLKKKPPHPSHPLQALISINTLWWGGEGCQITITAHLYSEDLSARKVQKKRKKRKEKEIRRWWMFCYAAVFFFFKDSRLLFFSLLSPPVFIQRGEKKEVWWKKEPLKSLCFVARWNFLMATERMYRVDVFNFFFRYVLSKIYS